MTADREDRIPLYPLVEEFHSIQGEGFHTGKPAYFIRLGGCDTGCEWCDSRFSWDPGLHPLVSADDITGKVLLSGTDSVVVTGGEPLMYDLGPLSSRLKAHNIELYLETCGSEPLTGTWDWICLSPKKNRPPLDAVYDKANELKVIIENSGDFEWAEECRSKAPPGCRLYLQPEWSMYRTIIPEIVEYVKKKKYWTISLQVHKFMNIP